MSASWPNGGRVLMGESDWGPRGARRVVHSIAFMTRSVRASAPPTAEQTVARLRAMRRQQVWPLYVRLCRPPCAQASLALDAHGSSTPRLCRRRSA